MVSGGRVVNRVELVYKVNREIHAVRAYEIIVKLFNITVTASELEVPQAVGLAVVDVTVEVGVVEAAIVGGVVDVVVVGGEVTTVVTGSMVDAGVKLIVDVTPIVGATVALLALVVVGSATDVVLILLDCGDVTVVVGVTTIDPLIVETIVLIKKKGSP